MLIGVFGASEPVSRGITALPRVQEEWRESVSAPVSVMPAGMKMFWRRKLAYGIPEERMLR